MARYMFTSDGGNNLLCRGTPILDTNINLFTQDEFQERFFADIMKDSQTDIKVSNIKDWLKNCYPGNDNIPKRTYEKSLEDLEHKVYSQKIVTDNITVLKNILKTSTVGSNTKISLADNVFWESGFGSKDIIAVTVYTRFLTPASKLDPLSKEKAEIYWPEFDNSIIGFDKRFTGRLGFPNTEWVMTSPNKVNITYADGEVIEYDVTKERDPVGKYLAGNNNKNEAINNLTKYSCHDFIKYVETKELGDVAQVWNYLAFVAINAINNGNNFKKMREDSVMITTDSVVLLFCILLHLSCVYTGSREGVESGHCTLKHYLAGDVNYGLKLETMIDNHYNRIKSQLAATRLGLLIMKSDKSNFWYYRYSRGKIAKTNGGYMFPKDDRDKKISQINLLFQAVIDNIGDSLRGAEEIYNGFDNNAVDDEEVDSKFTTFCAAINTYKYHQLLTKLNTGSYVLHPSELLENYAKIIDPTITDIPNLDEVKDAAFIKDGITIQQGGGRDLVSIGGGNNSFTAAVDVEIYYYDFLLLTFIEHNYFGKIQNKTAADFFPVYYDFIVSEIDEDTNLFDYFGNYSDGVEDQGDEEHAAPDGDDLDEEHAPPDGDDLDEEHAAPDDDNYHEPQNDNIFQDFLDTHTDTYIIQRGRELAKLIYFAPDIGEIEEELALAEEEVEIRRGDFLEHETGDFLEDETGDNTGMVVATAQGHVDESSFLSQPTGTTSGLFVTPQNPKENTYNQFLTSQSVRVGLLGDGTSTSQKVTSVYRDINNAGYEGMEETGGRKPGRHKSKKNKHKISIKNKSKKNIKKKKTIKKKITKRHKKTRKQN